MYSQVSLQGCHQSLMPSYRLPQTVDSIRILDELGMVQNPERQETIAVLPCWNLDEEEQHVIGFGNDENQDMRLTSKIPLLSTCEECSFFHRENHFGRCDIKTETNPNQSANWFGLVSARA